MFNLVNIQKLFSSMVYTNHQKLQIYQLNFFINKQHLKREEALKIIHNYNFLLYILDIQLLI